MRRVYLKHLLRAKRGDMAIQSGISDLYTEVSFLCPLGTSPADREMESESGQWQRGHIDSVPMRDLQKTWIHLSVGQYVREDVNDSHCQ